MPPSMCPLGLDSKRPRVRGGGRPWAQPVPPPHLRGELGVANAAPRRATRLSQLPQRGLVFGEDFGTPPTPGQLPAMG